MFSPSPSRRWVPRGDRASAMTDCFVGGAHRLGDLAYARRAAAAPGGSGDETPRPRLSLSPSRYVAQLRPPQGARGGQPASPAFASRFGVLSETAGTVRVRCTVVVQQQRRRPTRAPTAMACRHCRPGGHRLSEVAMLPHVLPFVLAADAGRTGLCCVRLFHCVFGGLVRDLPPSVRCTLLSFEALCSTPCFEPDRHTQLWTRGHT